MTTPINLTIKSIHEMYRSGLETPETLIKKLRAQALDQDSFNAWIYLLSDSELQQYISALSLRPIADSPLWGVPFAIKDNIDLANVPTSAACVEYTRTPLHSSRTVELLIEAGAIPIGKTNLDQFATGLVGTRSPFGEGKNVFNSDYISGGSSAGSAIATALGQVAFALGTDTAGSGRVPAAFNNLVGHKPSKGLLSTAGVVPACKSLDCVSIFALTAEDAVQVFDVVAATDSKDPYSRENVAFNSGSYWNDQAAQSFKFGVPAQLEFDSDSDARTLFENTCLQLTEMGGESIPIDFEPFIEAAKLLYEGPWVAERAWATQDVDRAHMLPVIQDILATTENFDVTDTFAAQYKLQALKHICDRAMSEVDFLLTPTAPTCYLRSEIREQPIALNSKLGTYTNYVNLLDYAATAVPVGRLKCGVSWGVTLVGPAFSDIGLLSYAGALQAKQGLALGATPHVYSPSKSTSRIAPAKTVDVVVCGAHLKDQPLNWQLTDRGAKFKTLTRTTPDYALYALPDGKRPALVPRENGAAIEVEVWQMPMTEFGSFVAGIPSPLGIGKVALESGDNYPGFICEEGGIFGASDVSHFGGWRAYLASKSDR